jgi:hypothetical protein
MDPATETRLREFLLDELEASSIVIATYKHS